ncbi:MAG TPA: PP0621 family protein [Thermoanaerobaculia bacterium]
MLRFLVLALVVLLLWRATMLLLGRLGAGPERQVRGRRGGPGAAARGEELVRCAACGTRVPVSRALSAAAGSFCSEACRRAAPGGAS